MIPGQKSNYQRLRIKFKQCLKEHIPKTSTTKN